MKKRNSEFIVDYLSEIADDYAIEFAEWIEELSGSHIDSLDYHLYLDNDVKELLEIFKKQKGL
jgi:hypothetical protein